MTRRISILPDAVADQIAAGEVVERPASVVKELVENALDAGATRVRVELENGGKTLIEVSDDGWGMGREDAVLALDRHATSKIKVASDLVGVQTFGFRGEALPSIASVSRFVLTSAEGEGEATLLEVLGGRLEKVEAAARQRGTTVSVRTLFFNTPARRKFLRSVSSESRASYEAVATLALAHPEAGFDLLLDGRSRLSVPAGQDLSERLSGVWGRDLVSTLVPVNHAAGSFRVTGFIQRPADAQPTGRRTQLFINGRPFRDPFLVRAAEAGYRSAIAPGDRPSVLLLVEAPAGEIDVNVHPSKLEVRFRDRIGVERVVEEAVRHALGGLFAAAPLGHWGNAPGDGPQAAWTSYPASEAGHALDSQSAHDLFAPSVVDQEESSEPLVPPPLPNLVQLFDTYIVYEVPQAWVIVDQHSAHERVIYETAMAQLTGSPVAAQRLLLPLTLDLTDEEQDVVEQHKPALERIGFEVSAFGGRTVMIQSVPNPHPRFDAARCFKEMIADLARGRFGGWANPLERFAATFACRSAVMSGDKLDQREMRELILRLMACSLPPHDVHGRSTMVQLPREELERRFGRR
ncbi:MAG: DNA mismatch repair endonuclease MutL [Gemmatimonadota bacterium]